MSMSKRNTVVAAVLGLSSLAAAATLITQGPFGGPPATTAASAQQSDKPWLAVAPGRVEPPSGIIKVAAPAIGIVSKVLVKVNDTVFAGEPLILLNDDEIQARYAAAEAQAGIRRRLRDEQVVTGKALDRRRAEDAAADAETAVFDAPAVGGRAATHWPGTAPPP